MMFWQKIANFMQNLNDYYNLRYRSIILHEKRDEDYLFRLLIFMELMGMENPVSAYTLELQGLFLQDFHEWHLQAGMEHSPFEGITCC